MRFNHIFIWVSEVKHEESKHSVADDRHLVSRIPASFLSATAPSKPRSVDTLPGTVGNKPGINGGSGPHPLLLTRGGIGEHHHAMASRSLEGTRIEPHKDAGGFVTLNCL